MSDPNAARVCDLCCLTKQISRVAALSDCASAPCELLLSSIMGVSGLSDMAKAGVA